MDKLQTEHLTQMLRWLLENPLCVEAVCGLENVTAPDILDAMQRLESQGYYELLLVLLLRYHSEPPMIRAIAQYLGDRLSRTLRENGPRGELAVFRGYLTQAIAAKCTQ